MALRVPTVQVKLSRSESQTNLFTTVATDHPAVAARS